MKIKWSNKTYIDFKNVNRTGYVCTECSDITDDDEYGLSSERIIGTIIPSVSLNISNEGDGKKYCATRKIDDTARHTQNIYFEKLKDGMIWIEEYDLQ
tara:strand:- start:562 stop:855 length:294 start_codon:yes stop_codon:yes gene_type:complete